MPNDPRVKFHKGGKICRKDIEYLRKHPECYGFVKHNAAFGSGRGNRSIFEDGTPPDRPGGEGDPPTQTDTTTTTTTDFVGVPLGRPQFNAGEITGIAIGAIAAGASLELTRRAYLEYLEEERRKKGMLPVSQTDRPIRARRGGSILERTRAGVRGISTAIQSFEMTSRPAAPIQSDFAPISVESSPSSSGASTPSARSARSSAGSSSEFQSALAPAQLPTPVHQRIVEGGPGKKSGVIVEREPIHWSLLSQIPLDTDPNRLSTIFTSPEGTIGEIKAPPIIERAPIVEPKAPSMSYLQNELEKRYILINIENARPIAPLTKYGIGGEFRQLINGEPTLGRPWWLENPFPLVASINDNPMTDDIGRIDRIRGEIRVLEREIESRGGTLMTLDEREAMGTDISRPQRPAPAINTPVARPTDLAQSEFGRGSYELQGRSLIPSITPQEQLRFDLLNQSELELMPLDPPETLSSGQRTPPEMAAAMDRLNAMATRDSEITLMLANTELPPEIRAELKTEQINLNKEYKKELELSKGSSSAIIEQQKLDAAFETAQSKAALKSLKKVQSMLKTIRETPASSRSRISKTITPETPIANNPANDRINAARPTQIEMTETGLRANASLVESAAPRPAPALSEAEALERAIKQSKLEAGLGYTKSGESSKGDTAEILRAEQQSKGARQIEQQIIEQPKTGRGKGLAPGARERIIPVERPPPAPEQPAPAERTPAPIEQAQPKGTPLQPQETASGAAPRPALDIVDTFNAEYASLVEQERIAGRPLPEVPKEIREGPNPKMKSQKYIMEEIKKQLNEHFQHLEDFHRSVVESYTTEGRAVPEPSKSSLGEWEIKTDVVKQALKDPANANRTITLENGQEISMQEALGDLIARSKEIKRLTKNLGLSADNELKAVSKAMAETKAPSKSTFGGKKGKLTKKTGLLATEEQRLRPTALAGEARTRVQARAGAPAPETARATAPEMSARSILAPETSARVPDLRSARTMSAPAPTPATAPVPPEERASFAERRAFFEETSKVKPPTGEPAPSAPPSAPESEIQTPREGIITERTPAERASFAEEVRLGMNKKIPARQKAKINMGKTSKITRNPLDIFVSPQYRNAPNVEIHPGSKNLLGALSELGARVPRLIPTREVLLSAGGSLASEGGGMVAGFYAGSAAGQEMSKYFATHPPKNRGEEYGQALATSMVALGVGNLTAKVVTYVIKQGARAAIGAEVSGSISSAGIGGASAILEAALFATVATTTQFYTTKALEDAGYNHSTSRGLGSAAATEALLGLEFVSFMMKGGPLNPYAIGSFVASELFILGFGIWSFFEETEEGRLEDIAEQAEREAEQARIAEARVERQIAVDKINKTNYLRAGFMASMETHDYDFDKVYATLSDDDKIAMGISTPESKASFQRQVESAFDPFGAFAEPSLGVSEPEVLSPIEQQRRDVFNSYINWYLGELRGETQPPFNFNDPKVKELDEYSGGTWKSAAGVTATTNHMQSERVNPLIVKAQNEIVDAFHNDRKTIEEMDPETVRYANLDPNFRNVYEAYIVSEAQAQILIEFNRTQYTYNDVDPKLLAIADRDPNFRATADAYYQTIANQARDLEMPIQDVIRLNSLMENEQAVEIGKLNDARNKIIEQNMASNQAAIDAYNANILREINIYGSNFEAIIRNINDQALLSGHTFLYATTKADLYRQLHMEMPELELVDPVDEIDKPNATWHPGKGRKVGDTAIYNYRYNLTDEQNQELEDMIAKGEITRADAERQAAFIRERDRPLFTETDQERAAALNMSIDDYHAKFGITIDVFDMPIKDYTIDYDKPPENGRIRMSDGSIKTYRNGVLIDTTAPTIIETPIPNYNPTLPQQPDGEVKMPNGAVRTYKDGLVVNVVYNASTPGIERLTPDQINAKEKPPIIPIQPGTEPTYEQLQQQYPETYKTLLRKYGDDPTGPAQIEAALRKAYSNGFNETTGETNSGLTPGGQPDREPTYEELKTMYPDKYTLFSSTYKSMHSQASQETIDKQTELYLKQQYEKNPVPLPTPTPTKPTTPVPQILFSGERTMPDGVIRLYSNGKILGFEYPPNYPADKKIKNNAELTKLNNTEGLYYVDDPNPSAPTPTTPIDPATLKQGDVKMPDGTTRTYQNGLVIYIEYPVGSKTAGQKTPKQINEEEGVRDATYTPTAPTPVAPVAPTAPLKQGYVSMPDGSKLIYKDGLVISVSYPEGKTGPTINEINTRDGVQTATPRPAAAPAPAAAAAPAPVTAAPPPGNTTAQALNLAVAPARAPATTSMPEDTTPGIAN